MLVAIAAIFLITSCGESSAEKENNENDDSTNVAIELKTENISYSPLEDTTVMHGFVAYNAKAKEGELPVVIIVHEWWGVTDYVKNRARQLAELGYIAFAIDMFGRGQTADNPEQAQKLTMPFYQNRNEANKRIQAALNKIKSFNQADTNNVVAIGYCFGGSMVLNAAKAGLPLDGVVSFHGGLTGIKPEKGKTKAAVLVCHGGADQFVPDKDVEKFKREMDSVGANYTFKVYPGATHAFTNPQATENGKKFKLPIAYNAAADKDSWKDFIEFMEKVNSK